VTGADSRLRLFAKTVIFFASIAKLRGIANGEEFAIVTYLHFSQKSEDRTFLPPINRCATIGFFSESEIVPGRSFTKKKKLKRKLIRRFFKEAAVSFFRHSESYFDL